ncbi:MAG TPA: TRAP transporter substrate-binding protein [Zeimonas sp.]|nr:TRAP transporter substrate-binding protein [Zeimonas sp.]
MMLRNFTSMALAGACALAIGASAANADSPVELRLAHWVPPTHPIQVHGMEQWAESIAEASGGTITVTLYPAQQLGQAGDHYDMARDGIADMTYVNPGYQPGRFPIIGAGELPFLVSNAKGGTRAFDEWYRKYAEREMRDVKFCFAFLHDPGSFHSRTKKIMVPEDVSGMKIRPAHATMATFVTMLGGTNVQASAPEVRDVIEKGVADAVTFPWGSVILFGIDRVTKYHMNAPLYATTFAMVFNKSKYNRMSAAQKKVIDDHCTNEWAVRSASPWADFEHDGIAKLAAEEGHEVYELSSEQVAAWKKAAEPLHKTWADNVRKVGANPDTVMRELEAALEKHGAAAK